MVAVFVEKNEETKVGSCRSVVPLLRGYNPTAGASTASIP